MVPDLVFSELLIILMALPSYVEKFSFIRVQYVNIWHRSDVSHGILYAASFRSTVSILS